ncbi:MAG: chorismate mutase [Candidatus Acidiferrales bacterium]|jgi:chorismate mutase-like protein
MSQIKIGDWRAKIDAIDTTLLHLLNVRAGFALEVGRLKGASGIALRVPAREQEILSRMKSLNPGPLDSEAVGKIYRLILHESIRIQVAHGLGKLVLPKRRKTGTGARPHGKRPKADRSAKTAKVAAA